MSISWFGLLSWIPSFSFSFLEFYVLLHCPFSNDSFLEMAFCVHFSEGWSFDQCLWHSSFPTLIKQQNYTAFHFFRLEERQSLRSGNKIGSSSASINSCFVGLLGKVELKQELISADHICVGKTQGKEWKHEHQFLQCL